MMRYDAVVQLFFRIPSIANTVAFTAALQRRRAVYRTTVLQIVAGAVTVNSTNLAQRRCVVLEVPGIACTINR